MGRHRDQNPSAGLQLGRHADQSGAILLDVLEHVEDGDQIVGAVRDSGEAGQRRIHHGMAEPRTRDVPGGGVHLDRVDPAELTEHGEIVPCAAADLENPRVGGQLDAARDEVAQYLSARPVPPMQLIDLRHPVVDDAFHQILAISRTPTGG